MERILIGLVPFYMKINVTVSMYNVLFSSTQKHYRMHTIITRFSNEKKKNGRALFGVVRRKTKRVKPRDD
jgi:superfamily I DNA and/or RNA helicase